MLLLDLLRSDGSIVVNKKLAHAIGIDAAILYSELISKEKYFADRGQLTEDGYFFNTVENIQEDTTLSKDKQLKALKVLVEQGLIKQVNRGLPRKRYFKIIKNEKNVRRVLQSQQLADFTTTSNRENGQQDIVKADNNNTNNNTKKNNIKDNKGAAAHYKGTESNSVRSFSFDDYKRKHPLLSQERLDIIECVDYYLNLYREYREQEHPRLKEDQWDYVVENIFYIHGDENGFEFDLDDTSVCEMIEQHFKTEYKNCDYNIMHFMSDSIRRNRMFEVAY